MSEERLVELESRAALQEQSINELSDALFVQQRRLDEMEQTCRTLLELVRTLAESRGPGGDEPETPPRY